MGGSQDGDAMTNLSPRQAAILEFIRAFIDMRVVYGYAPTVREIQDGCQISSTSVVGHHLMQLDKAGYINRISGVSRGIELASERLSLK